ncbi:MAG: Flp pilus assembly complex ATPase component TadA [Proteobacteria bacterium]|nr:Flp pilus assembly complex ATPase component TadA [Pseudomonadota bacterium]MBU0967139.1 Flp pilus assembly complex ATPase component TadA [Pseudomonadota bacterium]
MQYLDNETYLLDVLVRQGLMSNEQQKLVIVKKELQRQVLIRIIRDQERGRKRKYIREIDLVDIIVSLNLELLGRKNEFLTEEMIIRAVADDLGLPFKKLDPLELDLDVVTKTIPESFALKHLLLPFAVKNGVLEVAINEPENRTLLEEIERANQIKVRAHLSTKSDLKKILSEFFGFKSSISAAENHLGGPMVDLGNLEQLVKISSSKEITSSDQNIKSAVEHLFNYAFDERASDIHIEPKREVSRVRLRIDGVLHTIYDLPKVVHPAIISRIKFLSRLDIAEKRRPQDGRIKVDRGGKEAEIRVSTIPVAFGEKAVMRILSSDIMFKDIRDIGFSERDYSVYQKMMDSPHGIMLVTGPTGSGKSTTLYSTLQNLASPEVNIVTVEDPVEMIHEDFNQISVQSQIDVTFATILRNILRQDPDIIMIGEIRDLETATNAIQAALTGHLVFSTLHTNDAVSAITRLMELGVQPFLVCSTLLGAMAQRLVRTICPHCVESFTLPTADLQGFGFPLPDLPQLTLRRGQGCRRCRGTGFIGRCGIFEIFPMSEQIKKQVSQGASAGDIAKVARREGMTTLKEDAWHKVMRGITTHEEAIRVTGSAELI